MLPVVRKSMDYLQGVLIKNANKKMIIPTSKKIETWDTLDMCSSDDCTSCHIMETYMSHCTHHMYFINYFRFRYYETAE